MDKKNFIILLLVFFVAILTNIFFVFRMKNNFLTGFLFLVLFLIFGLICLTALYKDFVWSYYSLMLYFALANLNLIYVYINSFHYLTIFFIGLVFNVYGLFVSLFNLSVPSVKRFVEVEVDKGSDITKERIPVKIVKERVPEVEVYGIKEREKKARKGKYVASTTGSVYHSPDCEWAKKIKKENLIWFKDEREARRKGYKKHSCLK